MEKDNIKVIVDYPLREERQTETVYFEFDSKTTLSDLFGCIESEMKLYSLSHYYEGTELANYIGICPFICCNNKVIWNVPYEEVTVENFIATHRISNNTLFVEVDCCGCDGGVLLDGIYQSWIIVTKMLEDVGYVMELKDLLVMLLCVFGRTKKNVPCADNVESFLLSEDTWRLQTLALQTGFSEDYLEVLLKRIGYEVVDGVYCKNSQKVEEYYKEKEEFDYNDYIRNYLGFNSNVDPFWASVLNTNLIWLYVLSCKVDNQKTYDVVSEKIDAMINDEEREHYCYDVENDIILEEIRKLERKIGIE